jgi:hypothetical protein
MAVRFLSPKEELTGVLAKLRLARDVDPKHSNTKSDGSKVIHTDCDICTNQKRLDYLLDMISKQYKLGEKV